MPTTTKSPVAIAYDLHGEGGEPVLLLPGGGMPAAFWQLHHVPALLAAGYRCITADLRGMPPSECPEFRYTVMDMAADMAALLDELALGPVRLVGYSMGAWTGQELCLARPDLVRSAVLMGTLASRAAYEDAWTKAHIAWRESGVKIPPLFEAVAILGQALPASRVNDDAVIRPWLDMYQTGVGIPRDSIGQWYAADAYRDRVDPLARIRVPCLFIGFEHDIITPARLGRELAARIASAEWKEVAGAGHMTPLDTPDVVSRLTLDFFARN